MVSPTRGGASYPSRTTSIPGLLSFGFLTGLLLHALVDIEEDLRTGRALELRRPRLALGIEADFQRVPVDLVDAQHDRTFFRALGHGHIDGLRRLGRVDLLRADLKHLVTVFEGVLVAFKDDDEPLQLVGRYLYTGSDTGLDGPDALEFLDLLLEVRLVIRPRVGSVGRGETDDTKQCRQRDSHTCSPRPVEDSDIAAEGTRPTFPTGIRVHGRPTATCPSSPASPRCRTPASGLRIPPRLFP